MLINDRFRASVDLQLGRITLHTIDGQSLDLDIGDRYLLFDIARRIDLAASMLIQCDEAGNHTLKNKRGDNHE